MLRAWSGLSEGTTRWTRRVRRSRGWRSSCCPICLGATAPRSGYGWEHSRNRNYLKALRLARTGTIPFFILACVVIAMWASRWMSESAAFWAVLFFSNFPPVLAHASLATVDMACAATVLMALYAAMRWIEAPTWQAAVFLSVSLALAIGCKFSSAPFLGGCAVLFWALSISIPGHRRVWARTAGRRFQAVMHLVCLTTLLLWACYKFQVVPIGDSASLAEWTSGHSDLYAMLARLGSVPFPPSRLVQGLMAVAYHNSVGHPAYLLGQYGTTGLVQILTRASGCEDAARFTSSCPHGTRTVVVALADHTLATCGYGALPIGHPCGLRPPAHQHWAPLRAAYIPASWPS